MGTRSMMLPPAVVSCVGSFAIHHTNIISENDAYAADNRASRGLDLHKLDRVASCFNFSLQWLRDRPGVPRIVRQELAWKIEDIAPQLSQLYALEGRTKAPTVGHWKANMLLLRLETCGAQHWDPLRGRTAFLGSRLSMPVDVARMPMQ